MSARNGKEQRFPRMIPPRVHNAVLNLNDPYRSRAWKTTQAEVRGNHQPGVTWRLHLVKTLPWSFQWPMWVTSQVFPESADEHGLVHHMQTSSFVFFCIHFEMTRAWWERATAEQLRQRDRSEEQARIENVANEKWQRINKQIRRLQAIRRRLDGPNEKLDRKILKLKAELDEQAAKR